MPKHRDFYYDRVDYSHPLCGKHAEEYRAHGLKVREWGSNGRLDSRYFYHDERERLTLQLEQAKAEITRLINQIAKALASCSYCGGEGYISHWEEDRDCGGHQCEHYCNHCTSLRRALEAPDLLAPRCVEQERRLIEENAKVVLSDEEVDKIIMKVREGSPFEDEEPTADQILSERNEMRRIIAGNRDVEGSKSFTKYDLPKIDRAVSKIRRKRG